MQPELVNFEVVPKIVRADGEAEIAIRPLYEHCRFRPDVTYEVSYYPCEGFAERTGWRNGDPATQRPPTRIEDSVLRVRQYFEGEQEHVVRVQARSGDQCRPVGAFRIYSVRDDLFRRRAYKGDMHIHSCRSDGRESPGYVMGACRRIGLDFVALTDHGKYAPSIEARDAFAGVETDLRMFPGEEIHPPANPVHIVNFGGRFSVSDLLADEACYRASVQQVEARLGALPPGVDRYQYASAVWCFDKIRQAGGLAVYSHPYWFVDWRYSPPGALTSHLLDTQPYDALEVIGGYHRSEVDSNTLQVARYHEERARGRRIPIVGVSDAHGCERGELFGWYYTIVFSPSPELGDLIESIEAMYSVAVEALPGETPRPYGPFRLVKYALFLLREVFPRHDELCQEEGRLMLAHLAGDSAAAEQLRLLKGRTAALLERCWQGTGGA